MCSPAGEAAPAAAPGSPWRHFLLSPWPATVLAVVCFVNTLPNDFTYDDYAIVQHNPRIRALTNVRDIWLRDWWHIHDDSDPNPARDRLYRPLTVFTFALNHAVHGVRPAGFHAVNVLLHAAVCFLVWHFARRLTDDRAVAGVAAALFAVHPIHAEAVANVVGRAEVLAALFLLLGLLAILPRRGAPGLGRALLAAPAFLAALLAKESALCYPALALLVLLIMSPARGAARRWWLMHVVCLLLPLLAYWPLRFAALEQQVIRHEPLALLMNPLIAASAGERVLGAFTILGVYLRLLVLPDQLCCDYGLAIFDPRAGFTPLTLLGMVAAGGLMMALFGFIRRGLLARRIAALTAMFLASYLLISNTFLLIGVSLAERLMYWPSVLLLILAAVGIVEFWRRQCSPGGGWARSANLLRVLGVLLILAFGLRCAVRNVDWQDNYTLFARDAAQRPEGAHLNKCFASELIKLANRTPSRADKVVLLAAAESNLGAALHVDPGYAEALALRGQVRAWLGNEDGAFLDLDGALLLEPGNRGARQTLAQLRLHGTGDAEDRLDALRADVATHPDDAALLLELGSACVEYGQYDEALNHFEHVLALDPNDITARRRQAETLALRHEYERASAAFQRVLELDPDNWRAHANLSKLLADEDPTTSLRHARRAHESQPRDLRTNLNLAEAYNLNDQTPAALRIYHDIARVLDEDDPFRQVVLERIKRLERE